MKKDFYWVTEETRQFMEKGYLDPGQTVEERAWEIAKHAEDILMRQEINTDKVGDHHTARVVAENFAENFYNCLAKGWFSLSTPVWVNFGKDKGLPISCFGTQVQDDTFDI